MTHSRPDWDEYFLGIARAVSTRGECRRSQVGAVLVHDRRITATGYNGVTAGAPSCLDGICPREQAGVPRGTLYAVARCIAVHAEVNAIRDAENRGLLPHDGTIYLTKEPCEDCAVVLDDYGLRVVWQDLTRQSGGSMAPGSTESAV